MFSKTIFCLFLLLSGCIGHYPQPPVENVQIFHHTGPLQCGVAKIALTPYKKTVLAGYGPFERVAEKTYYDKTRNLKHHCFARAIVFANGGQIASGKKYLAYVSIDLLIINDALRELVFKKTPKDISLVLCATHPHSSIGGYWEGVFPKLAMGSFDLENLEYLAQKIYQVIITARNNLQPAQIGFAETTVANLTKNRRREKDPVDPMFQLIHIKSALGKPLANMVWFAAHPTMMPSELWEFSSDFPGAFARYLEKDKEYLTLFFQGGLGDVRPKVPPTLWKNSPHRIERRVNRVEAMGKAMAEHVEQLTRNIEMASQVCLSHISPPFNLGRVNVNAIPDLLVPIEIAARIWIDWGYMPETASLALTHIQTPSTKIIIANFPFELTSAITIDLRRDLQKEYKMAMVTSLANGWYSYLLHWPSAMYPPWGPEYMESFFDPGYAESLMNYARKIGEWLAYKIRIQESELGR